MRARDFTDLPNAPDGSRLSVSIGAGGTACAGGRGL
jgi:hypothetical protein